MKTKILLAAVAGALVMPVPMASQADVMGGTDFTIYGRVVAGANRTDSDKPMEDAVWDLGASGRDGTLDRGSRLGFKASRDVGGMTVGFKLERQVTNGGLTNQRHQYVSIGGDFGTITAGNQGSPYLMGANWAQEWFHGGATVRTFRQEGLGYSYNSGPFSLGVLLTGNNGAPQNTDRTTVDGRIADDTIDDTVIGASYDFGVVKVGVSYWGNNTENNYDSTALTVSGSVDAFEYYVGYQQLGDARQIADQACEFDSMGAAEANANGDKGVCGDLDGWGVFLGYNLNDADKIYLEYESQSADIASSINAGNEFTNLVVGYSHKFGGSVRFIAEYGKKDVDGMDGRASGAVEHPDPTSLTLALLASF